MIKALDILSAVLTLICLNLVHKSYKIWLVYAVASVMFTVVMICKHLPGMTIMGLFLIGTGISNYIKGRKYEFTRYTKR